MSCATFAHETKSAEAPKSRTASLRVNHPGDAFEREADRVADEVTSSKKTPGWSLGRVSLSHLQRQATPDAQTNPSSPAPQSNNYKEGAEKLGEAFLQTDVGKKLRDAATQDPLVKGAEDFFATLPGKIIVGTAAAGTVTALAATHTALPAQVPEIPLDMVRPGLKVKITYEGPVDRPTKAMISFSFTPQGDKKKTAQTASEKYRAQTAQMAADQEKFREGLKYKPGSPEDLKQKAEQKMMDDWMLHRMGALPGTGGVPLTPRADQPAAGGQQQQGAQWSFSPQAQSDLDKKLELQPLTTGAGATLQRKCACQKSGSGGECEECKKKSKTMQKKSAGPTEDDVAPSIVDQVLSSPGRPMDKATRDYFEPRFGYDLAKVRVHTDEQAAESARAVNALAYTVGDRIVFASGSYTPHNTEGRRLLAHELTHTIQQSAVGPLSSERLSKGASQGAEKRQTAPVASGAPAAPLFAATSPPGRLGQPTLQRAPETRRTYDTPPGGSKVPATPPAPGPPAPHPPVCGPDVSAQVRAVVTLLKNAWNGWNANQRDEACWALENIKCGPDCWDIVQLHNRSWIDLDFTPACAGVHANPGCEASVTMDGQCHHAGSVNYVIFGQMCRLCDLWESTLATLIWLYKHKSSNYEGSRNWALAGFGDWPSSGTPPPDRVSCSPACPTPYGPTAHNAAAAFDFHWYPPHATETVSADCPNALETHRDLRDNPPMMEGAGF